MLTATRPQLHRVAYIDQALRAGRWPNAQTLARDLEVAARTIQRDLDFLRDRLGAPVAYDPIHHGYHYTQPDFRLPYFRLSEGELVSVFLAERLLRQYQGTPFEQNLKQAFTKIVQNLPQEVSVNLAELHQALSVTPMVLTVQDVATFETLSRAVLEGREVELDYHSAAQGKRGKRLVDPYHLAMRGDDWYLVGRCHTRQDVRMFATQRVKAARLTGARFTRPSDFRIEDYFGGSFRALRGDGEHHVLLRFTPNGAAWVRDKIFHPTQSSEPTPDGGLLLRMVVSDLRELRRWIFFWGAECVALEPKELQQSIQKELRRMTDQYERPRRKR